MTPLGFFFYPCSLCRLLSYGPETWSWASRRCPGPSRNPAGRSRSAVWRAAAAAYAMRGSDCHPQMWGRSAPPPQAPPLPRYSSDQCLWTDAASCFLKINRVKIVHKTSQNLRGCPGYTPHSFHRKITIYLYKVSHSISWPCVPQSDHTF